MLFDHRRRIGLVGRRVGRSFGEVGESQ
jgi:hypothetical protein